MEKTPSYRPHLNVLCGVKMENLRPGVTAVLEPLNITDTVASGSVVVTMQKQLPIIVCNFSTEKSSSEKRNMSRGPGGSIC